MYTLHSLDICCLVQDAISAAGGRDAYRRLSTRAPWFCLSCQNPCCLTGQPLNVLQYLKPVEELEEEQRRVTNILQEAMDKTMRRVTAYLEAQG